MLDDMFKYIWIDPECRIRLYGPFDEILQFEDLAWQKESLSVKKFDLIIITDPGISFFQADKPLMVIKDAQGGVFIFL